ncbi:MAG: L-seryl-tRNA(Sec) selenium transferase, partial [Spirochaetes bacterium GWB1_59_5]
EIEAYFALISRSLATKTVTKALAAEREHALTDEAYVADEKVCRAAALAALKVMDRKRQRKILNGTGIMLNTNLGRAPVSISAWEGARDAVTGYAPVELDLEAGKRGKRGALCHELAATLAGAEAALVVNNNAAAVLLALSALSQGKEVIVARGEQVQIGGGFRVPDILELAGARFVEVGTTNIVDADDYRKACGLETACALIVHTSNFALRGFTAKPTPAELVAALPVSVPVIVDQGSGCTTERIPGETPVRTYLEAGCALVCFSGDKLLGGPQSGIIAGSAELIARLAKHPLYRAFRPGKAIYALLERVLVERLNGEEGPAGAAMALPLEELKKLARKIRGKLPKGIATVIDTKAAAGGGSGPDEVFDSVGLELDPPSSAGALQAALRRASVPLVALARDGKVIVDMSTLMHEDANLVADTISWGLEHSASLRVKAERIVDAGLSDAAK